AGARLAAALGARAPREHRGDRRGAPTSGRAEPARALPRGPADQTRAVPLGADVPGHDHAVPVDDRAGGAPRRAPAPGRRAHGRARGGALLRDQRRPPARDRPVLTVDAPDERVMRLALEEARARAAGGAVPGGGVVVRGGEILARQGNARERERDPTAHAEILALRQASSAIGSWHLEGCAMVVTLEPCAMCAGAIVLARLDRLVFGASDPQGGGGGGG